MTIERRSRGVGMWFQDAIMDILAAADAANLDIASVIDTPEMEIYRRGYEAAIGAIALAFGLLYTPRSQMPKRQRDTLPPDYVPFVKR